MYQQEVLDIAVQNLKSDITCILFIVLEYVQSKVTFKLLELYIF